MFTFEPLRELLEARSLSFRQLARDCNLTSNATVALNNDQSVRLEVIVTICEYLDVNIEDVIEIKRKP